MLKEILFATFSFLVLLLIVRLMSRRKVQKTARIFAEQCYNENLYTTSDNVSDYIKIVADGHICSYREFRQRF